MQKIKWRPISKEVELLVAPPKPAKFYMPEWFKKTPKFDENKTIKEDPYNLSPTFKSCMPFIDTFMTGYIQETWCDIFIEVNKNSFKWRYAQDPQIINTRNSSKHLPQVEGFNSKEFVWRQVWIPELPQNYSMIYTHPFNRHDLPFLSLSGIVDNDKYFMENVANHPFFVKEGFSGYIPQGTPMFQMIPIKRESWKSLILNYDPKLELQHKKVKSYFFNGYKKLYWQKKNYE